MRTQRSSLDRGWAWLVVVAVFGVHVTTSAMAKCFGVLLIDLQETFSCSVWQLTIVQGTAMALWLGLAPVSTALSARFSYRKVVFVAGIFGTVGFVGSAFSPTFSWFFFFHGVVVGIGYGLAYSPSLVILVRYFDKRRGIAMGIAQSGVGFGSVIVPVVVRYLVNEYGLRGAVLLQGAVMAHICVCAMLMRPIDVEEPTEHTVDDGVETQRQKATSVTSLEPPRTESDAKKELSTGDCRDVAVHAETSNKNRALDTMEWELAFLPEDVTVSIKPSGGTQSRCPTRRRLCRMVQSKYFNWSLLYNPLFVIYFLGTLTSSLTYEVSFTMLCSLATDRNISREDAGFLPSIIGIADFVGRLFIGPFSDLQLIPRRYIFSASVILTGVNAILVPFTSSYATIAISSAFYGILGSFDFLLYTLVLADVLGVHTCASAYGLVSFFIAIGLLSVSPVIGLLHDVTGSWYVSFWFTGALCVAGGVISSFETVIRRCFNVPATHLPHSSPTPRHSAMTD